MDDEDNVVAEWIRNPMTARKRDDARKAMEQFSKELNAVAAASQDPNVRAASERLAGAVSAYKLLGGK